MPPGGTGSGPPRDHGGGGGGPDRRRLRPLPGRDRRSRLDRPLHRLRRCGLPGDAPGSWRWPRRRAPARAAPGPRLPDAQEAVWLGVAYLVLLLGAAGVGQPLVGALRGLPWPVVGGAVLALPWVVRNALTFDGGTLGQTSSWRSPRGTSRSSPSPTGRPSRPTWRTAPWSSSGRLLEGLRHDLVDVILVPAAPVGIVGLIALVALRRSPALC